MMDNLIFGMHHLNITQLPGGSYSHPNYAMDLAGEDSGVDFWFNKMPNTCFKCTGQFGARSTGNTRFFMSCDDTGNPKLVRCADLEARVVTLALTHSNKDFETGKIYHPGDVLYQEGTAGKATGNHIHLEVAEGMQTTKTYDPAMGVYRMANELNPLRMFFVSDDFTTVVDTRGADLAHCPTAVSTGLTIIDGKNKLLEDGEEIVIPGEHQIGEDWYYIKGDGTAAAHEEILLKDGRWVRYDDAGCMIKGLCLVLDEGEAKVYYYSTVTGEMNHKEKNVKFDPVTGIVKNLTIVRRR